MLYVGIDLAWNDRARTGVAVLDSTGRLLDSATVRSDEEVDDWLEASTDSGDDVIDVVAVDAPLIVTNPTGQRPCERMVSAAYRAFDAGCHPSNTSKAYMDPPRAYRLATRHGWVVDPASSEPGVCLEVYPHPAMVGLFGLGRILPYKNKQHRPLEVRIGAMRELVGLLESLPGMQLESNLRWATIRQSLTAATRPMHLGRVEDEVDAIFCAYLAWLWRHEPDALAVYGDTTTGYIVAPPPPAHSPSRRPATRDQAPVVRP